jgi:mannan endo-1,4-beta-mannosidase
MNCPSFSLSGTFLLTVLSTFSSPAHAAEPRSFFKTNGPTFQRGGQPSYFIGTNYWYGAILASTAEGGNRARLLRELDLMRDAGITNLRILVGAEGPDHQPTRVTPALQIAPGQYDDALFDGLDFLLCEMQKRGQCAVLYLLNSWEWSGGYSQYLNWNGYGDIPYPAIKPNTWNDFKAYAAQFFHCEKAREQFRAHIRYTLARTNRYSGVRYADDPTIFSWEIANEPRAFSKENLPAFEAWIAETAALIKSLDRNHLVTTGTEGEVGCEHSLEVFERIHANRDIDYLTMHIWPKNWGWIKPNQITETIGDAVAKTNAYMERHIEIARRLKKPIVLEEFGLPRDLHSYSLADGTAHRDAYYKNAFDLVLAHAARGDVLAGANFWAFGGTGRPNPRHEFWRPGDDYLGDPPQEEQGLNSVFDTDATMKLIQDYALKVNRAAAQHPRA